MPRGRPPVSLVGSSDGDASAMSGVAGSSVGSSMTIRSDCSGTIPAWLGLA